MTRKTKNDAQPKRHGGMIPLDFHIEVMPRGRGYRALICGVRAVKSFSYECIVLRLKRRSLKIVGDELEIASLEDNVVEISGSIKEFEFLYDKF